MQLKVDITDEAVVWALQTVGNMVIKNAKESLLGTELKAKEAGYKTLRNGEEVTLEEIEKKRGEKHTPAKYELKIEIEI